MPHPAFPISLHVRGRRCLVVGTSDRARERASRLVACGANAVLLAPDEFFATDLAGVFCVMGHTDDRPTDEAIVAAARAAGALAYGHDLPEISDFAMPAVASHGTIKLAISTEGEAPALARRLREELQRILDESADDLDALVDQLIELRRALPSERRGEIYPVARRLRLSGRFSVDSEK